MNRHQKRKLQSLGLQESLVVASPPKGSLVVFVSDGTIGAHTNVIATASDLAVQLIVEGLMKKLREGPEGVSGSFATAGADGVTPEAPIEEVIK